MSTGGTAFNKAHALREAQKLRNEALERKEFFADEPSIVRAHKIDLLEKRAALNEKKDVLIEERNALNTEIDELNRRTGIGLEKFKQLITAIDGEEKGGDSVEPTLFRSLSSTLGEELLEIYRKEKVGNMEKQAKVLPITKAAVNKLYEDYYKARTKKLNKLYYQRQDVLKAVEAALEALSKLGSKEWAENTNSTWTESPERLEVLKRLEEEHQRAQAEVNRLQALGNAPASVTRFNTPQLSLAEPNAARKNAANRAEKNALNRTILALNPKAFFGITRRKNSRITASSPLPQQTIRPEGAVSAGVTSTRYFPPARSVAPSLRRMQQTRSSRLLAIHPLGSDGKLSFPDIKGVKFLINDEIYVWFNPFEIFMYDVLLLFTVLISKSDDGKVFFTRAYEALTNKQKPNRELYDFVEYDGWRTRSLAGDVEVDNLLDRETVQLVFGIPGQYTFTTITHVLVKVSVLDKFLSYKTANPGADYMRTNSSLLSELVQYNSLSVEIVLRYFEPMSAYDEPVFKMRKMMETVRVGTNCYMDVGRLRIGSYEPVLEFLEPYADYLICCVTTEAGRLYVQFNELTEREQRTYPALMDLRAAQHYVRAPFINFDDWMKQMSEPFLLPRFEPFAVTLTPAREVRERLRDKTLNAVSASSMHSESKGDREYRVPSIPSLSDSGEPAYHASSAPVRSVSGTGQTSSAHSTSNDASPFSISERKEPPSSSSSSAASGPQGGLDTVLGGAKSLWGGVTGAFSRGKNVVTGAAGTLTGTVSSFLKPPPLHEAYSPPVGPFGLPKRTRRARRTRRTRRTRRRTQ